MHNLNLNKQIKWYHWTLLYFFWSIAIVLAFLILFMARTTFRILFFDFVVNGWLGQDMATFLDKLLVSIVGLVILGFIVFTQDYFYKAIGRNLLLTRFLRILGIEFLTLFVFNTVIVIPKCFSREGINLLLLIGFELVAGVVLMIFSFRSYKKEVR